MPFERDGDRFVVPSFRGAAASRVVLDDRLTLHTGLDALVIQAPCFLLLTDGQRRALEPGNPASLASAESLLRAVCRTVAFEEDGRLIVDLADGRRLEVPPDPQRVTWQIIVGGGLTMACRPGGELVFARAPLR